MCSGGVHTVVVQCCCLSSLSSNNRLSKTGSLQANACAWLLTCRKGMSPMMPSSPLRARASWLTGFCRIGHGVAGQGPQLLPEHPDCTQPGTTKDERQACWNHAAEARQVHTTVQAVSSCPCSTRRPQHTAAYSKPLLNQILPTCSMKVRATTPTKLTPPSAIAPSCCPAEAAVSCHRCSIAAGAGGEGRRAACMEEAAQPST